MTDRELIDWLRASSAGVYCPAAKAADRLEQLISTGPIRREEFVRCGGKYPEDAVLFDVVGNTFHPLGGGAVYTARPNFLEKFRRVTAADRAAKWRSAYFEIDGLEGRFAGFTCGNRWNGWACPAFCKPVAHQILEALQHAECGANRGADAFTWRYDPDADAFYHKHTDAGCDEEICESHMHIKVDDIDRRVYPIGAQQWTWDECADEETEH